MLRILSVVAVFVVMLVVVGCQPPQSMNGVRIADARTDPGYPGLSMEEPSKIKNPDGSVSWSDEPTPVTTEQLAKRQRIADRQKAAYAALMAKERANGLIEAGPSEFRDCKMDSMVPVLKGTRDSVSITSPVPFRVLKWQLTPLPPGPGDPVPPQVPAIITIDGRDHPVMVGTQFNGEIREKGRTVTVTSPSGKCVNVHELRLYR